MSSKVILPMRCVTGSYSWYHRGLLGQHTPRQDQPWRGALILLHKEFTLTTEAHYIATKDTHFQGYQEHVEEHTCCKNAGSKKEIHTIGLMQGAYRDDDSKPVVLNVVREAESRIAGANFMEYLPIGGLKAFNDLSVKLAFGEDAECIKEGRVAAVQSLSGTGEQISLYMSSHTAAVRLFTHPDM